MRTTTQKQSIDDLASGASTLCKSYITRGMKSIDGWMSEQSALLVAGIDQIQRALNIVGGVGEIGVHHGRLFVLLALCRQSGERAFAVDVFEAQELNIDNSGRGDRVAFLRNLDRFNIDLSSVEIFSCSSMDLRAEQIESRVGPVRLLSIDGGHTAEITLNDLRLASEVLHDGGVVVIDDVFNAVFPAVSVGLATFLADSPGVVPFAISREKTFLCRQANASQFRELLSARALHYYVRDEIYFGNRVAIINDTPMVAYGESALLSPALATLLHRSASYNRIRTTRAVRLAVPIIRKALSR